MIPFSLDEGLLDETSAVRLFAAAQLSQVTGTFTFQRESGTKWVNFKRGKPVGARSSQINESLGRLLVAWGWITQEAYVASLERMDTGKEKHGQILASMGALDQNRIPEALRKQTMTRLADAVSWTGGRYRFSLSDVPDGEEFPLWTVLQEGLYKRHGRPGIEAQAAQLKAAVPRRIGGLFESFVLAYPDAMKLYDRIDGKRSLAELGKHHPQQLVFMTNLLLLKELDLVMFNEAAAEDPLEKAFKKARQLSPADLLQVTAKSTPEDIHAAMGRLLSRFPADKVGESRFYPPLVKLIEEAATKLINSSKVEAKNADGVSLQAERAFQMGRELLTKKQNAAAAQKFAEAAHYAPQAPEIRGYLAWAQLLDSPGDQERMLTAEQDLETAAAADPDDADLQAFLGSVLKLTGRLVEAEVALVRALELSADNALAKRELESVRMRLGHKHDKDAVNVRAVHLDARIILQRWIGGNSIIHNFHKDEVRIGSGIKDDVAVSETVLPQVTPAHCTVVREHERLIVRRNGSAGLIFINDRLVQPREEVIVTANDRVVLGNPNEGTVLEFRVLDHAFLAKLIRDQARKNAKEDSWVG